MISDKTIGRLSLYRRLLHMLLAEGAQNVFSHELAAMARGTAAQVRRDLMVTGFSGSPTRGYEIRGLVESIGRFLDGSTSQHVSLVGIGNLGQAILAYFSGRRPRLSIVAAFDNDPAKVNRAIHGCRCHPVERLETVTREKAVRIGIITVPAEAAQDTAERLCHAGVRGILNFAPVRLAVPREVYVENLDVTMVLEKVAFFARQHPSNGVFR